MIRLTAAKQYVKTTKSFCDLIIIYCNTLVITVLNLIKILVALATIVVISVNHLIITQIKTP